VRDTVGETPAAPPVRWASVAPDALLWEQFDDEYFVFNPASGHTHLLNALGATALRLLDARPLTAAELLAQLHAQVGGGHDEQLQQALSGHLEQLATIGLIEPAS